MLEALFRQKSDSSYKAMARVKNLILDDLRQTNKPSSVTHMIDRHFTVDPNTHMFIGCFEFKPPTSPNSIPLRLCIIKNNNKLFDFILIFSFV